MADKRLRITHAQVLYAMGRASGKSPRAAAEAAGYANVTRRRIYQLEHSQELQEYIEEELAAQGVTMDVVARTLAEGLAATRVESFCTRAGEIVQTEPMIDHPTRHKYAQTVIELLGLTAHSLKGVAAEQGQPGIDLLAVAERAAHLSDEELTDMLQRVLIGTFNASAAPPSGTGTGSPKAGWPV